MSKTLSRKIVLKKPRSENRKDVKPPTPDSTPTPIASPTPASPPPTRNTDTTLAVRVSWETVARIDKLATRNSKPGLTATRTDAHRMALLAGLEMLEKLEK